MTPPDNVKADVARARAQLFVQRPRRVPRWVLTYIERKASLADLLATLKKRTHRAPSAANQALAMDLINEASRTARGARIVAEALDQQTVEAFVGHEKGDAR